MAHVIAIFDGQLRLSKSSTLFAQPIDPLELEKRQPMQVGTVLGVEGHPL